MTSRKLTSDRETHDSDIHKGALEQDNPSDAGQGSLRGQLSHRDRDPLIKAYDTDFPEPDAEPEHSGER